MGRRTWIKIYCDKWLEGSLRQEKPAVRGVWTDLLALCGGGAFSQLGEIKITKTVGFSDLMLARVLNITPQMWTFCKKRLIETGRIEVLPANPKQKSIINSHPNAPLPANPDAESTLKTAPQTPPWGSNIIVIKNWKRYQSEYERQKPQRTKSADESADESAGIDYRVEIIDGRVKNEDDEKLELAPNPNPIYSSESLEMKLSLLIKNLILKNNPKAKVPQSLDTWCGCFDKMVRLDNRSEDELISVINFSQSDNFWKSNILSPQKLRDKFDTLWLQSKETNQKPNPRAIPKPHEYTRPEDYQATREYIKPEDYHA